MISKLEIHNFRSIKKLKIKFNKMNAFIGPNNVGKSNILKALNLILGEYYPTYRSFDEKDFFKMDKQNTIKIDATFDKVVNKDTKGFLLTFDGKENLKYIAKTNKGSRKVKKEDREEISLIYIPVDRSSESNIRPTKWTLYGKILQKINDQIKEEDKKKFKEEIEKITNETIKAYLKQMNNLKEYVKKYTKLDIDLKFSFIEPINILKTLLILFKENELEFPPDAAGEGIQSLLIISIAKLYTEIVKKSLIFLIEEPELYLHPNACRNFFRIMKELTTQGIQFIYTTHSKYLIDPWDPDLNINLVTKEKGETKIYQYYFSNQNHNDLKSISKIDENITEALFADCVILVEGFADRLMCYLSLNKMGMDLYFENISIVECSGKTNVKSIASFFKKFKIPVFALIDKDNDNNNEENERILHSLGEDNVFFQEPDLEGMWGNCNDIKQIIEQDRNKKIKKEHIKQIEEVFNKIQENEIPEIYKKLKERIQELKKT